MDKTNQSVSIETLAVDFTKVTEKDYDKIQELSNKYPVSVLGKWSDCTSSTR